MPPANHDLHVKVTKDQKTKIETNAEIMGFNTVSDFLRYMSLEAGFTMEKRVKELHDAIVGKNQQQLNKSRQESNKRDGTFTSAALYESVKQDYVPLGDYHGS